MLSEKDAVEAVSKGATEGALTWGKTEIQRLVKQFTQRELVFIEDEQTIELVVSQRSKPEWAFYRRYVTDRDLILQIEMGLCLRKLEPDVKRIQDLRRKIVDKFGSPGLHVAEMVQNGVFIRYIGILLEGTQNEKDLKDGVTTTLKEIDKFCVFVKADNDPEKLGRALISRITANLPKALLLFAAWDDAISIADLVFQKIQTEVDGYAFEFETRLGPDNKVAQKSYFISKKTG